MEWARIGEPSMITAAKHGHIKLGSDGLYIISVSARFEFYGQCTDEGRIAGP